MRRLLLAVTAAVAVGAAGAASASAETICFPAMVAGCTTSSNNLEQALSIAQNNPGPGPDTVQIAAGTYSTNPGCGLSYFPADPNHATTIVGAGVGRTTLTCGANDDTNGVITLTGPATLTGVTVNIPAGDSGFGVHLNNGAVADRIEVTADPTSTGDTGVSAFGSTLKNSTVTVPTGDDNNAVNDFNGSTVDGVQMVAGGQAVQIDGGGTLAHSYLTAPTGVTVDSPGAIVYDSLIDITKNGSLPQVGLQVDNGNPFTGPLGLSARNVTIVGGGAGAIGADDEAAFSGQTATLTLQDSIISGPATALQRNAVAGATANLNTSYDDYAAGAYTGTGSGSTAQSGPPLAADPMFVNPSDRNYRLSQNSPLIDAGTPGPLQPGEPATDLDGAPRLLNGQASLVKSQAMCVARRDIGAYEVSPSFVPVFGTTVTPFTVAVGRPATFTTAACSPDPSATLTYTWTFDDGTSASGATVTHAFAKPGDHTARVAVLDSAGRTGGIGTVVSVIGPEPPAPVISHVRITPSRFGARGATITYNDTEAVPTSVVVFLRGNGVRRGRDCVPAPRHVGRHQRRCKRLITLVGFTHNDQVGANSVHLGVQIRHRHLNPGHYILSLTPVFQDGRDGGIIGKTVLVPFTVKR
jgi:hypothetical protein